MKKKLLKSASLVALSAVMMGGAAVSFAACGVDGYTIRISMFCGDNDVAVNRATCEAWAAEYTAKLREDGTFTEEEAVKVDFNYASETRQYFQSLSSQIANNSQPDVFYISPKYVKLWSRLGKILDLSEALKTNQETLDAVAGIWEDSVAFYSYSKDPNYNQGDRVAYDEASKSFKTANGITVGVYGLPKDYSNFGLGFNEVFFTQEVRDALTSKKTTDRDGAKGAENAPATLTYNSESGVVVDEPDGSDVPLVNIGVPTWYKPYNFYKFASYQEALDGGDPMAAAVEFYTGGAGYCVTIPGWPGDTFEEAKAYWNELEGDDVTDVKVSSAQASQGKTLADAEYDEEQGYITYTYAEYSALTWAVTYYFNTFKWQEGATSGGVKTATGMKNVYGNDTYDGVLYLLPWLAGNNAQYLNQKSDVAVSESGNNTYTMKKPTLYGEEDVTVNWGINNPEFLETVGAFYAYGSDWNGNSNNVGDTTTDKPSGWDMFCAGYCVFYGVGTWNAGELNKTDRQYLRYRLMPEPVSEDYALASLVKNEDYEIVGYGDLKDAVTFTQSNGTDNPTCDIQADLSAYSAKEIFENQVTRQDKWGARMDSVGYGVSALVNNYGDWRKDAAIDLVRYLTIDEKTQVSLTYAGSQLPNFRQQCVDYYNNTGDFADMTTPDDAAKWDKAYGVAKAMFAAAGEKTTVGAWMQANGQGLKYDQQFANDSMDTIDDLSDTMKILMMCSYEKADRDLSLRMQYGLNAVRDSAMYTYNDIWLTTIDARGKNFVMSYAQQEAYPGTKMTDILKAMLYAKDGDKAVQPGTNYGTPAWFYAYSQADVVKNLNAAIALEKNLLGNN